MRYDCLITASVILNCLVSHRDPNRVYLHFFKTLCSLAKKHNVHFYMTDIDYYSSFLIPPLCGFSSEKDNSTLLRIIKDLFEFLHPLKTTSFTLDEASQYLQYGPLDAIRITSAINGGFSIITWDPSHFTCTQKDRERVTSLKYGEIFAGCVEECHENGKQEETRIEVFSVDSFVHYLEKRRHDKNNSSVDEEASESLKLETFDVKGTFEWNQITAVVSHRDIQLSHTASGEALVGTLLAAIKECTTRLFSLPEFTMEVWQGAPVMQVSGLSDVYVGLEDKDGNLYQAVASHTSVLHASGKAYIKVMNDVIQHRRLLPSKP